MSSAALHPLARQALIASRSPVCYGWTFGMTKYLAHDDPGQCVEWALDLIQPYLNEPGQYADVVTRSNDFLRGVLINPVAANLEQVGEFGWQAWSHRTVTGGGGPLARLLWAAMGIVELAAPGQAAALSDSRIF